MAGRFFLAGLLAVAFAGGAPAQEDRPPNVVLLVADDLGYADIGCHGGRDIPTPHIDSLAKNGVRCTAGYSNHPACAPARAALLSGLYPHRFGFEFNPGPPRSASPRFGLPREVPTLAERLSEAGYATGLVGKWHLGYRAGLRPHERGFAFHFGFLGGSFGYLPTAPLRGARLDPLARNGTPVPGEREYLTDAFAREAAAFVGRNRARPFFLCVAFNAAHDPLQATARYERRFPRLEGARKTYAAVVSALDDAVGRVLGSLREHGLEERTLVVFTNDNGGPTAETTARNDPFQGAKGDMYEGGIRVPLLWQWKGVLPAGRVFAPPAALVDVHATALAAAGLPPPSDRPLDGVDLLPYLTGRRAGQPRDRLFWRSGRQHAARLGDWKLVYSFRRAALFDLRADPGEATDLAAREPARLRELEAAYAAWEKEMSPPLWITREEKKRAAAAPGPSGPLLALGAAGAAAVAAGVLVLRRRRRTLPPPA